MKLIKQTAMRAVAHRREHDVARSRVKLAVEPGTRSSNIPARDMHHVRP
jgi:hypothetical protein